jgi:hypothetical protein
MARSPDWPKMRLEYVNGHESLREIAARYQVNPAGVLARAGREKWEESRRQQQAQVVAQVQARVTVDRATELADAISQDLDIAKALRSHVKAALAKAHASKRIIPAAELRVLVQSAEVLQRVVRIALDADSDAAKQGDVRKQAAALRQRVAAMDHATDASDEPAAAEVSDDV